MDYNNMRVVDLKALAKELGLRGYSKLKKGKLITFLWKNLQPVRTRPPRPTRPPPPPPTWKPIDDKPRPTAQALVRLDQIGQDRQNCNCLIHRM